MNYIEVKQLIERRQLNKKGEANRWRDKTASEGLALPEGRGRSKPNNGGNGDECDGKDVGTIQRGEVR